MKKLTVCLLYLILFCSWIAPVWSADNVIVVLSNPVSLYQSVLSGIEKTASFKILKILVPRNPNEMRTMLQTISSQDTDLVITIGSYATASVQTNFPQMPIVFSAVLQDAKFVNQRTTGIKMEVKTEHYLKMIKLVFPDIKRIGALYSPAYSKAKIQIMRSLESKYKWSFIPIAVETEYDINSALKKMTKGNIDILWSFVDPVTGRADSIKKHIYHSIEEEIPFLTFSSQFVKAGAFAALELDYFDLGVQTAELASHVLTKKDFPKAQDPRKLILYVNGKTKKMIGWKDLPTSPELVKIEK